MPSKGKASGAEIAVAVSATLGIVFFMTAEALEWLPTWAALGGVLLSAGVLVGGAIVVNLRDSRKAGE